MKSRTFKEWVNDGYLITKGSKAVSFNEKNEALFTENQVRKKPLSVTSMKEWITQKTQNFGLRHPPIKCINI
jgi:hypothetical protein